MGDPSHQAGVAKNERFVCFSAAGYGLSPFDASTAVVAALRY
jgi:hypothetical protein